MKSFCAYRLMDVLYCITGPTKGQSCQSSTEITHPAPAVSVPHRHFTFQVMFDSFRKVLSTLSCFSFARSNSCFWNTGLFRSSLSTWLIFQLFLKMIQIGLFWRVLFGPGNSLIDVIRNMRLMHPFFIVRYELPSFDNPNALIHFFY